ncbi:MAG: hypothetical protein PVJ21_20725 [Anaerolineales bacterium]|jgi:hypothetical protein
MEYIFLAATFWGIAASGPKILNLDGDLPRHLLVGQLTLQNASVSTVDIFSFRTTGFPSYPHEWLAQVLLAIPYKIFGLDGVVLLVALVITLTFAVVFRTARKVSTPLIALIFTGLALSASTIHILPRPHIFTYLFVVIWIYFMEKVQTSHNRAWWFFPILMLMWVNIHGMFLLGILIWLAYVIGDIFDQGIKAWRQSKRTRLFLTSGLVSIPVTFLSPSGSGIWKSIFNLGSNTYITSRIPEYQPANFHLPGTWPFILMLGLLIIGLGLNTKKLPASSIFTSAGFAMLALYSSRIIPIFAIVAAPITARVFSNWLQAQRPKSRFTKMEAFIQNMEGQSGGVVWVFITAIIVIGLFASGVTIDPQHKGNVFDEQVFPVDAVRWLKDHPQNGHMLNDFNWGGYILLETWPEYQIFMDGHTHIYGEALTREYERVITTSQSWETVLEKYQIEWAILPSSSLLADTLSNQGWKMLYNDQTAVILRASSTP